MVQAEVGERSERIRASFNNFRAGNKDVLKELYHPKVVFEDPVGRHDGLEALTKYYDGMYENVTDIHFEFKPDAIDGERHLATWVMTLKASGLNGGEAVIVPGVSEIVFDPATNLVIYHRDYFDMGQMIYEQVPVLGALIRFIKNRFK